MGIQEAVTPVTLEGLYRENADRVYAMALRAVGDSSAAEDIAQTTFLKAMEGLSRFRGEAKPSTWLIQIAVNEIRMHFRRAKRSRETAAGDAAAVADDAPQASRRRHSRTPLEQAETAERTQAVRAAFAKLDDEDRLVLTLGPIGGNSHAQIANILETTVAAVRGRLYRARLAFKQALMRGGAVSLES